MNSESEYRIKSDMMKLMLEFDGICKRIFTTPDSLRNNQTMNELTNFNQDFKESLLKGTGNNPQIHQMLSLFTYS